MWRSNKRNDNDHLSTKMTAQNHEQRYAKAKMTRGIIEWTKTFVILRRHMTVWLNNTTRAIMKWSYTWCNKTFSDDKSIAEKGILMLKTIRHIIVTKVFQDLIENCQKKLQTTLQTWLIFDELCASVGVIYCPTVANGLIKLSLVGRRERLILAAPVQIKIIPGCTHQCGKIAYGILKFW